MPAHYVLEQWLESVDAGVYMARSFLLLPRVNWVDIHRDYLLNSGRGDLALHART